MKIKKSMALIAFITAILLAFGLQNSSEHKVLFEKAKFTMETKGDLKGAIKLFEEIIKKYPHERSYSAKSQLYIGLCYEKLGVKEAQKAYQKVIDNYPEQAEAVKVAKEKLSILIRAKAPIEKVDRKLKIRQIWAGRGVDILGSVSPDGKYLCFTDWNTGDLAIRDLSTGKNRRLTNKGSWLKSQEFALFSEWAPDSKHIVYNWYNGPKEDFFELHTVGIDGSEPNVLYRNIEASYPQAFDWSPDGKSILAGFFNLENDNFQIGLITLKDGSIRIIKRFKKAYARTSPWGFNFSPDGSYIAYDFTSGKNTQNRDIYLLSADGSREIPLIKHPALDYVLEWTPDGRGLLFGSGRTGSQGLWFIRVKEGKPLRTPILIKDNIGTILPMGCTAKGNFFYGIPSDISNIYTAEIDPNTGQVLTPPKKKVLFYEGHNYYPDYSPDGKKLAYMRLFLGRTEPFRQDTLCIVSLDTGEEIELNPSLRQFGYPRWSPDGKYISLEGFEEEGQNGIFRIDVQTGEYEPVVVCENEYEIYSHRWSVDGSAIFYTRGNRKAKTSLIFVHDFETGQDRKLAGSPSDAKDIDISPDGKSLVLLNREKKRVLRTIPTAGGEPQELYSFVEQDGNFILTPAWTADGHFILLPKRQPLQVDGQDMPMDMWRIPVEGGEPQKLNLTMYRIRHLSVHPDGLHLAFSAMGSILKFPEVWVMENFLPEEKK